VKEAPEVAQVCGLFRQSTRDIVDAEIARGSIPRLITFLPSRLAPCERGTVWKVK
jgi:hypothetical protein